MIGYSQSKIVRPLRSVASLYLVSCFVAGFGIEPARECFTFPRASLPGFPFMSVKQVF